MPSTATPWTPSNRKTSSRKNGAIARPKPFTIDHFRLWASILVLDNGRNWAVEPFQLQIVEEVFRGYREVVAVLPTGSYKTTTSAGLALYHCQFTRDARVPIGAAAADQAKILYDQAAGFVRRTPSLESRFKVAKTAKAGGIWCPATGGVIRVFSAKDDTGDGIIPTLPILDELHRHRGHDLYGTWQGKLTKRNATLLVLSTAGDGENNPVEVLRAAARKLPNVKRRGRHTVARSAGREFVMHEYALRDTDDPDDLKLVKMANPASQVTTEELRMRRDSPSTKRWQWLRFTCNLPSKGEESAIDPEHWDGLAEKGLTPDPAARKWGLLDLGWKIDTTGIAVLTWESKERRLVTDSTELEPPVDESDVVVGLLRLQARYGESLEGIVFDPNAGGQQMAQLLEAGEHPLQFDDAARAKKALPPLNGRPLPPLTFIAHSQKNAPMALAAVRFDEAFRNGWIRHDGSPTLRRHVLNAVARPTGAGGEEWRYDRPSDAKGDKRKEYPIDLFTGVLMGHSVAVGIHEEPEGPDPADLLNYRIGFIG